MVKEEQTQYVCLYFNIFPSGERGTERAKDPAQTWVRRASDTHRDHVTLGPREGAAPQNCRDSSPLCTGPSFTPCPVPRDPSDAEPQQGGGTAGHQTVTTPSAQCPNGGLGSGSTARASNPCWGGLPRGGDSSPAMGVSQTGFRGGCPIKLRKDEQSSAPWGLVPGKWRGACGRGWGKGGGRKGAHSRPWGLVGWVQSQGEDEWARD